MNVDDYNELFLSKLSDYLSNNSRYINKSLIDRFKKDIVVNDKEAIIMLLSSVLDLDNVLVDYYLKESLSELDINDYINDSYYNDIKLDKVSNNTFKIDYLEYLPYELFVYDDFIKLDDGRIIPRIGYFKDKYIYPCVMENNNIWMLITPNEINTMKKAINNSFGNVLTYGLGLGYFIYMISLKDEVQSITVIEKNRDVIDLFNNYILPKFKYKDKIKIICDDAYEYAKKKIFYDYVFIDIYHDVSDGLDDYIYFKMLERDDVKYDYWIEDTIKCYL